MQATPVISRPRVATALGRTVNAWSLPSDEAPGSDWDVAEVPQLFDLALSVLL